MYIYIYTHIYIYTYMHTHKQRCLQASSTAGGTALQNWTSVFQRVKPVPEDRRSGVLPIFGSEDWRNEPFDLRPRRWKKSTSPRVEGRSRLSCGSGTGSHRRSRFDRLGAAASEAQGLARGCMGRPISLLTLDFRGFDSSIMLIIRGGIPRPIRNFPESLSQAMLVVPGSTARRMPRARRAPSLSSIPRTITIYVYIDREREIDR